MKRKIKTKLKTRPKKRILTLKEKTIKLKPKRTKRKDTKQVELTNKEKLFEIIRDKNISLKELLEKFKNKKELFRDLQDLTDARVIGFSETAGHGVKYFLK